MTDHIKRITIDLADDATADEAQGIAQAILEKLGRCWAQTTTGPIYCNGRHVANASVKIVPLDLQLTATQADSDDHQTVSPAPADQKQDRAPRAREQVNQCRALLDGECWWNGCPQLRDNEPRATGRHCPLDIGCARCGRADDDCQC